MATPTPQQLQELHDLEAAYDSAVTDSQTKAVLAAQKAQAAAIARQEADGAKAAADAAVVTENTALKALKDFVDRLFDPVTGIVVTPGEPMTRP